MGWHYELNFTCTLLPEFYDFIESECIFNTHNRCDTCMDIQENPKCECNTLENYDKLPKIYRDLVDIWRKLEIGNRYREYSFRRATGVFKCNITKKVTSHKGNLWDDLLLFMKDIIVPISSHISYCNLSSDDYGDISRDYTDNELRDIHFDLKSQIKHIEHIWEDGAVVETRVMYKRSIKKELLVDLNRSYGLKG